jgi:formate dehydrogenase subunit gamma
MWFSNPLIQLRALGLLLLTVGVLVGIAPSTAAAEEPVSPIMVPNPATDLWRAVRQRDFPGVGNTQARGVETGVLIAKSGEDFRNYRQQDFIGNAGLFIVAVAAAIGLFYFVRGRIRIPDGRTGRRIKRFADIDRVVHWFTAILFVFLGLTGLTLLFGRFVMLPLMGPEAFSVIASAAKEGHNLFGPLFLISIVMLFVRFAAKNLFARGDIKWLVKGGGIVGKGHVSAGYFNAGEKIWFWLVMLLGITVSISGLVLVFPVFGQGREIMQLALIIHGIAAVVFIAGSFGHIYIGTVGTEGSLESMTTGYVDENWAKAHHDRWYGEIIGAPTSAAYDSSEITGATLQSSLNKT